MNDEKINHWRACLLAGAILIGVAVASRPCAAGVPKRSGSFPDRHVVRNEGRPLVRFGGGGLPIPPGSGTKNHA